VSFVFVSFTYTKEERKPNKTRKGEKGRKEIKREPVK